MPPDPLALNYRDSPHPGTVPSTDEALLAWAGENVKVPWLRICRCWDKMSKGEAVRAVEAQLPIPLTPFTADMRAMFYVMRDLNPLMTFEPGNLFTIILDSTGTRILRAYMERTRMNAYISLDEVRLDPSWTRRAEEIITSGNLFPLKELLSAHMVRERGVYVNWVKIANVRFFGAFKDALEEFAGPGTLSSYIAAAYRAVREIYSHGWIAFSPKPKGFARLEEIIGTDSKGLIQYDPSDISDGEKDTELTNLLNETYIVALRGRDHTVALRMSGKEPFTLFLDQDISSSVNGIPFHRLPRALARKTGARTVLAFQADAAYNILHEYLLRPFPYTKTDTEIILKKLLYMVREYTTQWAIYPVPIALKWYARVGRFLGLPYDISRLSYWFLPKLIVEGGMIGLGHLQRVLLVVLDQDQVRSAVVAEMYEGGMRKIRTFPARELTPFFRSVPLREGLIKAKHHLWEKDGWINFAVAVQAGLIREALKLNLSGALSSLFGLSRAFPSIKRAWEMIKKGGLAVYPDRGLVEVDRWVKKTGRLRVWFTMAQIPFDRTRPRRRGLLYIRETIIALFALGAFLFILLGMML